MSTEVDLMVKTETLRLLQHVLKVVSNESSFVDKAEDPITRASILTGIHPKSLELIENTTWFRIFINVDRSIIHNEFIKFCLARQEFPTTYELYERLQKKLPHHMDIGSFRKVLIQMDYVWKNIRDDLLVVMERPEVTYERYHYLTNIIECEQAESPIYFISEGYLDQNYKMINLTDTDDTNDVLSRFIYAISRAEVLSFENVDNFDEETFENWIVSNLQLTLRSGSVVVITDLPHHKGKHIEPPTFKSLRMEIIAWLNKHEVPYDVNMSKYELMCLTKKYTDTKVNVYKIDNLLKSYGHKVLRLPKHLELMTPAALLAEAITNDISKRKELIDTAKVTKYVNDTVSKLVTTDLVTFKKNVIREYKKMLNDDKDVDRIWDILLENSMKKGSYVDTVLPTFSDEE